MRIEPVAAAAAVMVDACVTCRSLLVTAMLAEGRAREHWLVLRQRLDKLEANIAAEV